MTFSADKDLDDKIAILYLTGLSIAQVASRFGIGVQSARSSLKRTNTPRRTIKDAKTIRKEITLRLPAGRR